MGDKEVELLWIIFIPPLADVVLLLILATVEVVILTPFC
jgi:hypothetical protein